MKIFPPTDSQMDRLIYHVPSCLPASDELARDSIGGFAILPKGVWYPKCKCGQKMALLVQFDIRPEFGLPLKSNAHFLLFSCPIHGGLPDMFDTPLPDEFWKNRDDPRRSKFKALGVPLINASYQLILFTGEEQRSTEQDEWIEYHALQFEIKTEELSECDSLQWPPEPHRNNEGFPGLTPYRYRDAYGVEKFKIGGHPFPADVMEDMICCCGSPMIYFCQIPYPSEHFPVANSSPELDQNDIAPETEHSGFEPELFVDNMVYLFACGDNCSPFAVTAIV